MQNFVICSQLSNAPLHFKHSWCTSDMVNWNQLLVITRIINPVLTSFQPINKSPVESDILLCVTFIINWIEIIPRFAEVLSYALTWCVPTQLLAPYSADILISSMDFDMHHPTNQFIIHISNLLLDLLLRSMDFTNVVSISDFIFILQFIYYCSSWHGHALKTGSN
jgi:hypothetical protein